MAKKYLDTKTFYFKQQNKPQSETSYANEIVISFISNELKWKSIKMRDERLLFEIMAKEEWVNCST